MLSSKFFVTCCFSSPEAGEGGTVKQEQSSWRTASGQRVFGRAVETEETKKLDNQGILHVS